MKDESVEEVQERRESAQTAAMLSQLQPLNDLYDLDLRQSFERLTGPADPEQAGWLDLDDPETQDALDVDWDDVDTNRVIEAYATLPNHLRPHQVKKAVLGWWFEWIDRTRATLARVRTMNELYRVTNQATLVDGWFNATGLFEKDPLDSYQKLEAAFEKAEQKARWAEYARKFNTQSVPVGKVLCTKAMSKA